MLKINLILFLLTLSITLTLGQNAPLFQLLPASKTNINFANNLYEDDVFNVFINPYFYNGGGVAIGDINNDGLVDIFFTGNMVPNKLYLNKGNLQFEDITSTAFSNKNQDWSTGVTLVDINADGYLDIYVCHSANKFTNKIDQNTLYINNQNNTFIESAVQYNLQDSLSSTQAAFFDADLDGDLDAYVMNIPTLENSYDNYYKVYHETKFIPKSDQYYENVNGTFINKSKEAGIDNNAFGLGLSISDVDNNGTPDLYISNDYKERDHFYLNNKGTFTDKGLEAMKHTANFGMGTDFADINNDGYTDLIQMDMAYTKHIRSKTNMKSMAPEIFWAKVNKGQHYQYMNNMMQLNNGNGTFSDISYLTGVAKTNWSWGALFADFDNDGYKDLVITNGYQNDINNRDAIAKVDTILAKKRGQFTLETIIRTNTKYAPKNKEHNFLFRNNGNLTFEDKSIEWGFDLAVNSNGVAYGDLDNDGDLDLVINNLDAPASVYENVRGNQNNHLSIQLEGTEKNQFAIGARVTIYTQNGQQIQELFPTRGFQSSVDYRLHFGLGKLQKIDQIEIRWPNLKTTILHDIKTNQILKIAYDKATFSDPRIHSTHPPILADVSKDFFPDYTQEENTFSDFDHQILLPHMLSRQGPCLAVADIDNDGLEDVFVGGAKQHLPSLFLQQKRGELVQAPTHDFDASKNQEDLGAIFLDVDQDGDQDLYICSGGNEYVEEGYLLQDRLYLNNYGDLTLATNYLPKMHTSTKIVQAADFDQDGDLDLFVGGRLVPGQYPKAPRSYLLENDGTGHYKDVTQQYCPDLMQPGMVTGACFGDVDGDSRLDLTLLGEWMPLQVFLNKGDSFEKQSIDVATEGLWYSLKEVDLDGDGDLDFIGGNLGKNSKFKGTMDKPFNIYADDFDNNGTWDMMMSSYEGDKNYPVRGRDCSSEQMPALVDSFPSFQAFAIAEITDICGPKIEDALHLTARNFYTSFFINDGQGNFAIKKLPSEAQFSPIKDIHVEDLNQDGHIDLILVGNMYDTEVETVRYDAGRGVMLLGEGQGQFTPLSPLESGFFAWDNVKQIRKLNLGQRELYILAVNQGKLMTFEKQSIKKSKK
ncbi:MAG: VCBS repeat-containing protein [Aureispira sp.]